NATQTTKIYTLSLHDALPILKENPNSKFQAPEKIQISTCGVQKSLQSGRGQPHSRTLARDPSGLNARERPGVRLSSAALDFAARSEEHTSELQSLAYLVCRLL